MPVWLTPELPAGWDAQPPAHLPDQANRASPGDHLPGAGLLRWPTSMLPGRQH